MLESKGFFEIIFPGGLNRDLELERQVWNVFILNSDEPLPDNWVHKVTGDGIDKGMEFKYFWHPLDGPDQEFESPFRQLFEHIKT